MSKSSHISGLSKVYTHIYLAPASGGKTTYLLNEVYQATRTGPGPIRVLVSGGPQAAAWRRRLAELGGALGVRVQTFHELYLDILNLSDQPYVELSEPVQYRLLRAIVDDAPLDHYAPLKTRPGFISLLQNLIAELKAARIQPDDFQAAIAALGNEPRLAELSLLYSSYQTHLQTQDWADRAGLGWLAVEVLARDNLPLEPLGRLVVADGFDNFTQIQIDMLQALAGRCERLLISLTGSGDGVRRDLVHRRFDRTRRRLETALQIQAEPLPASSSGRPPALAHLEVRLYAEAPERVDGSGTLTLIEAPDRAAEAREGLRWLKARLVQDGARPTELALLARSIEPYRPFIAQVGAEFGLPLHFADGRPLRSNPAIAALLDLLRLVLPRTENNPEPALPRRQAVEAWRSPYFDWSALPAADAPSPIGIEPGDVVLLDAVARHGRVIGGNSHWQEAFELLSTRPVTGNEESDDEIWVDGRPPPAVVHILAEKFSRFSQRLKPPQTATIWAYVRWLEDLIGPDPALASDGPLRPTS